MPSILIINARSLSNKLDLLDFNLKFEASYCNLCLIAITETWLDCKTSEGDLAFDNYHTIRSDRDLERTGKTKGGGVLLLVHKNYSNNNTVKQVYCSQDLKVLCVVMRPFYLPREFSCVHVLVVYAPPSGNKSNAESLLSDMVHTARTQNPEAVVFLMGDFNTVRLPRSMKLHQLVSKPTREQRTLDLCYSNIKESHQCETLPPLGQSDHNVVLLNPTYQKVLLRS